MNLLFERFTEAYYPEYSSWFHDPELNSELGPMDDDWLNWVLTHDEAEGMAWAVFEGEELVGVVETAIDPEGKLPVGICALAVKPARRRQGIGSAVLRKLFSMDAQKGTFDYLAYIKATNSASRRLFEQLGFIPVSLQPDEHGFLEYRRTGLPPQEY